MYLHNYFCNLYTFCFCLKLKNQYGEPVKHRHMLTSEHIPEIYLAFYKGEII